jgi:hypothetical protein
MSTQPTNPLAVAVPGLTQEQISAVQVMAGAGMPPRDVITALHVQTSLNLHAAEQTKTHPFSKGLGLSTAEFAALRVHIMDGGGPSDLNVPLNSNGQGLDTLLWQAIHDEDQTQVGPLLIEHLKAHAKSTGRIRATASGGVIFNGVGPSGPTAPSTTGV